MAIINFIPEKLLTQGPEAVVLARGALEGNECEKEGPEKKQAPGLGRLGGDLPKPKGHLLAQARAEVFTFEFSTHTFESPFVVPDAGHFHSALPRFQSALNVLSWKAVNATAVPITCDD